MSPTYASNTPRSTSKAKRSDTPSGQPTFIPRWPIWPISRRRIHTLGLCTELGKHHGHENAHHRWFGGRSWNRRFRTRISAAQRNAFNETCAAVGNVLFNFRMFLAHKDAKYLERCRSFAPEQRARSGQLGRQPVLLRQPSGSDGNTLSITAPPKSPWFGTACCPSNMARLLPQVQGMTYAHDDKNLYLAMYAETSTELKMGATTLAISQNELPRRWPDRSLPQPGATFLLQPAYAHPHLDGRPIRARQTVPLLGLFFRKVGDFGKRKEVNPSIERGFAVLERVEKRRQGRSRIAYADPPERM